ncbi:MAG: glycosyltransferase family 4 protein [Deltaproteobacteria bacterium]|nr:glycosyltransferase family 4 protein [Deltaproteobacteria bacterium]
MTPRVLIVSKPLVPPWNDSGKNVARDVVTFARTTDFTVLTARPVASPFPANVTQVPVYRDARTFGPRLIENARVAWFLARQRTANIVHYFFAPNRTTSSVARAIAKLHRSQKTVQTVLSAPRDVASLLPNLFADRIVTVSRFRAHQIPGAVCIPPGIPIGECPSSDARSSARHRFGFDTEAFVALYAGDLEFSNTANFIAECVPRLALAAPRVRVVFACRTKTQLARDIDSRLRAELRAYSNVSFLGEVVGIRELLLAADVALLPTDDTFAKIDLPLVLLESLEVGTPILVGRIEPLTELLGNDGALAVDPRQSDELVATLKLLSESHNRVTQMREAAREAAVSRFDARDMAAAYDALYAELSARGVQPVVPG